MRLLASIFLFFAFFFSGSVIAQGGWTQKSSFSTQRCLMEAFTIGMKGYIATGNNPTLGAFQDLWEYDPVGDVWTQKANVPPVPRLRGVGFAANGKGYIGLGNSPSTSSMLTDLWEYDPIANTWTQRANFPSWGRFFGVGFAVGLKGYAGLGMDANTWAMAGDLWEYDPFANAWTQKANFPGGLRVGASSFVVGSRAYVGQGRDTLGNVYADLWEYNPFANTWQAKAPIPAVGRSMGLGITIFNRGYCGTGIDSLGNYLDDWFEYNPVSNTWAAMTNFPGGGRFHMVGFGINCRGYVGTGHWGSSPGVWFDDWYEFWPPAYHFATITSPGSTTICAGSPVTLTGNGGVSYIWSTGATTSSIVVVPTTQTTYTVTASTPAPLGCTSTATVTVYMKQLQLNASVTAINCSAANGVAQVTVNGGTAPYTYLWTPISQTNSVATGLAPLGQYTVNVTDVQGCTGQATFTVVALNAPTATATGPMTICTGQSSTLTAAAGAASYQWSTGATTQVITVTPTVTTTYTLMVNTGLCYDTGTVTVNVVTPPVATLNNDFTICNGTPTTLTAYGGVGPYNYLWSTTATTTSIAIAPGATTTYSVLIWVGTCRDSAQVTVTTVPSPTATITGMTTICPGDFTTLTASGGSLYSWSSGQQTPAISVSPPVTTTYSVVAGNGYCTHDTSVQVVVLHPAAQIQGKTDICLGDSTTFTASGGISFVWSTGQTTASIHPSSPGTYSVAAIIGSCADTSSVTLTVHALPVVDASDDVTIVQGQVANIYATGASSYVWSGSGAGFGAAQQVAPQYTTLYCVTGIDSWSCMDTACVNVYVVSCETAGELYLPNAFSPNGDGENDELQIFFGLFDCIKTFRLSVYNRWGERIYFTTDPFFKWNGLYNKGVLKDLDQLPGTEVFVYKMHVLLGNEEIIERTGNLSLFR